VSVQGGGGCVVLTVSYEKDKILLILMTLLLQL